MKIVKFSIIPFLLLLLTIQSSAFGQERQADEAYVYPVTGGEEWAKLFGPGFDNRVSACQVPIAELKALGTKALVLTCLDYPLLHEMHFTNSPQVAFRTLADGSNAFQELFSREDVAQAALEVFRELTPLSLKKYASLEEEGARQTFKRFNFAPVVLSQEEVLSKMTVQERKEMVSLGVQRFAEMKAQPEKFGFISFGSQAAPIARSLEMDQSSLRTADPVFQSEVSSYNSTGTLGSMEFLEALLIQAEYYSNN